MRYSWYTSVVKSSMLLHIRTQIIFLTILLETCGVPINNGFTMKFTPVSPKEEVKVKSFGALFAKIPQDLTDDKMTPEINHDVLLDEVFPQAQSYGTGCTNQIARIFPSRMFYEFNGSKSLDKVNFLNVPIVDQTFENYKIIVATAPKHLKIGKSQEAQPLVIYIIFNDDGVENSKSIKMPTIYFVSKVNDHADYKRKSKADPIFIIDSNRTVTGLKSTEVSKFIKFSNKLRNHFKYTVVP